jgi:hypothetical protein
MSLLTPMALLWTLLAIPIIVFYVLKVKLRRVPVSTTIFWQQIFDEKSPRSLWQHLRHLLSLLAQLALLMLLVFALAEPYFQSEFLQARRLILVIDNSASMNAQDITPSRLEVAKQTAEQFISSLRNRDEMAVVTGGAQPRVLCGFTGHERTLRTALAQVQPGDGPTQVAAAVTLGRRLLADAPHGRVVVLSDGCFPESVEWADDPAVELHVVGTRAGNVGLTNFQVRRSLADPIGYEILTRVSNASDEEVKCRLNIDLDDAPVDVIPLKLAPGQEWSKTIEKTSIEGGKLVARINHDDCLALDNRAEAVLPKRQLQRVTLLTDGNTFLKMALQANPLVELTVSAALPERFDPAVLYVFHRRVPAKMPLVNALVIDPIMSTDLWQLGETLENPIVTKQDPDSPLLRHVRLDNVLMPEARRVTPPEGSQILASSVTADPLYFLHTREGHKLLLLTVNLDRGDLALRTAFPIMITNALGWFAGQSGELRESLASGAITEVELPTSPPRTLVLLAPSGETRPLPSGLPRATIGPIDQCGIWRVQPAADPGAQKAVVPILELACNLASRTESDVRVPEKLTNNHVTASLAGGWLTRPIWFYLIALALLLAAAEWFLYQRRWIS